MQNNRSLDARNTEIINDWLDVNVYTATTFEHVIRYEDLEHQYAGVDLTFNIGDEEYVCDEKASTYRVNGFQGSFAFSVSQINRDGERRYDWFMNDTLNTDSYMLVWLDKADEGYDSLTYDSIRQVTCALVRKEAIKEYLESINWSVDRMKKMNDYMVEQNMSSWGNIYTKGVKWNYDTKYRERNINVVLPREALIKISDWHKTITK